LTTAPGERKKEAAAKWGRFVSVWKWRYRFAKERREGGKRAAGPPAARPRVRPGREREGKLRELGFGLVPEDGFLPFCFSSFFSTTF
jgi:hypothetical protein